MCAAGAGVSADRVGSSGHLADDRRDRWRRGAGGERATAALLEPLGLAGWVVLHDRRVPGMRANIDHLVASGTHLWVLDTKVWRGNIVRLGDGQLWYADAPVADRLAVVARIAEAVERALARRSEVAALEVRTAAVIQGVHAPAGTAVAGVLLLQPTELVACIAAPPVQLPASGDSLERLSTLFPPRDR